MYSEKQIMYKAKDRVKYKKYKRNKLKITDQL